MSSRAFMALALVVCTSCKGDGDLPADDVCGDTASAVAAAALGCSGDVAAANTQGALFARQFRCQPVTDDYAYQCAGYVHTAPCDAVLASSLEPLMKRWAPVCTRTVVSNPNSGLPVLPAGDASASGTLNNAAANLSCTFQTAAATVADPNGSVAAVQANAQCNGSNLGFNVVFTGTGQPAVQNVTFPGVDTAPVVSQPTVTLNANSRVDPFGFVRANGAFRLAGTAAQKPFQLSGEFDVVMIPSRP